VHLSPGAPPVDIAIKDGPVLFSDVGFKEASDYVEIAPGTYELEIRLTGTDALLDTATLTFEPNRVYTVFAIGTPPQIVQTVDEVYDPACPEFRTGPWEGDADFTVSSDRSRVVDFRIEIECAGNNFEVVAEEKPIEDCGIQFAASVFNLYQISGSGTFVSETDMEGSYSVTGSSNCSGTWQSTAVSDEGTTVYLPLVIRHWPPDRFAKPGLWTGTYDSSFRVTADDKVGDFSVTLPIPGTEAEECEITLTEEASIEDRHFSLGIVEGAFKFVEGDFDTPTTLSGVFHSVACQSQIWFYDEPLAWEASWAQP
jgi:hypothetical protein